MNLNNNLNTILLSSKYSIAIDNHDVLKKFLFSVMFFFFFYCIKVSNIQNVC